MKPIETTYNGNRFRSRTEARWAVFFKEYGLRYTYEKEGFALPTGQYLPDFWLNDWHAWVEIKAGPASERERQLCHELALSTSSTMLLVCGQPSDGEYDIEVFGGDGSGDDPASALAGPGFRFAQDRKVDEVLWVIEEDESAGFCVDPTGHPRSGESFLTGEWAGRLQVAFKLARSARFEHGEKPA